MKKPYWEKLKDPRWQKKRLEALSLSHWTCHSCCDTESELHVHHRYYISGREPWEYPVESLQVLCKECHDSTHEDRDQFYMENWELLLVTLGAFSYAPFSLEKVSLNAEKMVEEKICRRFDLINAMEVLFRNPGLIQEAVDVYWGKYDTEGQE